MVKKEDWSGALSPSKVADTVGAPRYWEKRAELYWARETWARKRREGIVARIGFMVVIVEFSECLWSAGRGVLLPFAWRDKA